MLRAVLSDGVIATFEYAKFIEQTRDAQVFRCGTRTRGIGEQKVTRQSATEAGSIENIDDITSLNASRLSEAIRDRDVSCVEVMQAYLDRIATYNHRYTAIVALRDQDTLIDEAKIADEELAAGSRCGWMHGMPHAVKDLADVRGIVNSSGSPLFRNRVSESDSIFVERIRANGAIFIGKTNVPEFGLGSQSYNDVYGTTGNAYDPGLTAGGSSGGAACALATHMLPVADGSDMMGSLRNPAAFNNVIGFRPTTGRVPRDSINHYLPQLASNGSMGRCVEDTIRLLQTISGHDQRDPNSLRDRLPSYEDMTRKPLTSFSIGWLADFNGYLATENGILTLCEQALDHIDGQGAHVEACDTRTDMAQLWETWMTLRQWTIAGVAEPLLNMPDWQKSLKPEMVWEIENGLRRTSKELFNATTGRTEWYDELSRLFEHYDILALPAAQVFPFDANLHWPKSIEGKEMDTYHRWMEVTIGASLAGCPTIALPAGFDEHNRPTGIQFLGRPGADTPLLQFALQYEAHTDYLKRRPEIKVA